MVHYGVICWCPTPWTALINRETQSEQA
jgi:hypothetical protein